jgi:hypothetical protein
MYNLEKKKWQKTLRYYVFSAVTILLSISWIFTLFYDIIVNEELFSNNWTWYLAIFFTLLSLYTLYKPNSKMRKQIEEQGNSVFLTTISFLIMIPLLTIITLQKSIIVPLHIMTKSPSKMTVEIETSISTRGCRGGVKLLGYKKFMNGRVCGLRKDTLSKIRKGDRLVLKGEKSLFGFTYDAYILIQKKE